jgi:hypothetical protein
MDLDKKSELFSLQNPRRSISHGKQRNQVGNKKQAEFITTRNTIIFKIGVDQSKENSKLQYTAPHKYKANEHGIFLCVTSTPKKIRVANT